MVLPAIPMLAAAAGFGGLGGLTAYFYCSMMPCCDNHWITKNFTGLDHDLRQKLHGQHLVQNAVLKHIQSHFNSDNPSKALVLSFHGLPGVGKNFVSQIIADNMYRDGMESTYVHFKSATNDFPHMGMINDYKVQLKSWIEEGVKKCERAMFIFDEVDTIPATLLDVLRPYTDHIGSLNGVNYRKAIFIFLSNVGGNGIQSLTLDHWRAGKKREDLALRELENTVMTETLNTENHGLGRSQLISHHLITAYIPFLPLEKEHVRMCIKDDLERKGRYNIREEFVDEVMKELTFSPKTEQIYSVTGCKRVSEKVDFVGIA